MPEIPWERFATSPREHQKEGVRALLKHKFFMLADEVGAGKSKQVVDASQILYEYSEIDTSVVTCPAFARGVWANPNKALGEVAKHSWPSVPYTVLEYSVKNPRLPKPGTLAPGLLWIVTNYEFIRRDERLLPLLNFLLRRKYLLICDEAWALADYGTDQWKAVNKVRKLAARIVLLNGTPVADTPLDLFAQMKLMHEDIIGIKWFSHFRSRYAVLKPNMNFPLITGYQNLEELSAKVAPYILRRRTRDCFDLPPVLEPIIIEAKLKDETWRIYKQMRDEFVAWLTEPVNDVGDPNEGPLASVAKQAFTKGLRLAQITSGFLGGVQKVDMNDMGMFDFSTEMEAGDRIVDKPETMIKEIGSEKLDTLLAWLPRIEQPERLLIWSRFRAEIERTCRRFNEDTGRAQRRMLMLYGQQSKADRAAAIALLNPDIPVDEPCGVVGHPAAGGAALNLAGASMDVTLSHDFSLRVYLQKRGRIDRMGQKHPIRYVDVVATGPKGQRTIDHHVLAALREKQDVATWTASTWRQKLLEE